MWTRRTLGALATVVALAALAGGCASALPAGTAAGSQTWSIVALGDSVPRGANCRCTPYPSLTARDLEAATRRSASTVNDSVSGYTSASVLRQLRTRSDVAAHVRNADVVEVEVGANDVGYSQRCGTRVACYTPRIPGIAANLAAIVDRVHRLTAGRKVVVVLLDYWSVWLGGRYAAAKGPAYVDAATRLTERVNAVIRSTAAQRHCAYVDLRRAFKGPSYSYDETHYLAGDGDHPNAAGHRRIASAARGVIARAVSAR